MLHPSQQSTSQHSHLCVKSTNALSYIKIRLRFGHFCDSHQVALQDYWYNKTIMQIAQNPLCYSEF